MWFASRLLNDRHGHDAGDEALRFVASKLARVGGGGRGFRYGGEEFTILFPGLGADAAAPHLEGLRRDIQESGFVLRRSSRRGTAGEGGRRRVILTVSVGVAARDGGIGDPHAALQAADKALYRAKKEGRNRVCR